MGLKLKLSVRTLPVELEGADGKTRLFELRELTAHDRDAYLDTVGQRVNTDSKGNISGIRKFDGMQADLLSRCLYDTETGKPVPASTIQVWPATAVTALFVEAQKLNHLASEGDEPKNG